MTRREPFSDDEDEQEADGFERASLAQLRERVDALEDRVERNQELIQMAAQRLREQRENNADIEDGP